MSLPTPKQMVQKLQTSLHAKAKAEPSYRFYTLWDKVYREDVLREAWRRCRANGGAGGADGVHLEDVEAEGVEAWLGNLQRELRAKQYRPQPLLRVWIPKSNGGQRPLGIPTIRDRVVQTAVVLVIGPIFEADLLPEQYGFRENLGAKMALRRVYYNVARDNRTEVVDADLSDYFNTIPHGPLMKCVSRRVTDGYVLAVIKMWLQSPVIERKLEGDRRTAEAKRTNRGTPQGSGISPLLANLYFRRFVLAWHAQGIDRETESAIINYADDFVIVSRGRAAEALAWTRRVMAGLKLTLNESKTCLKDVGTESFDFLGYTFGKVFNVYERKSYLAACPSKKSVRRLKQKLHAVLEPWNTGPWEEVAATVNRMLRGWSGYFRYGTLKRAYRAVDNHVFDRVRHCLRRRHKVKSSGSTLLPSGKSLGAWGIVRLREIFVGLRPHSCALG
jgi:RNA-directed DNA polymerase